MPPRRFSPRRSPRLWRFERPPAPPPPALPPRAPYEELPGAGRPPNPDEPGPSGARFGPNAPDPPPLGPARSRSPLPGPRLAPPPPPRGEEARAAEAATERVATDMQEALILTYQLDRILDFLVRNREPEGYLDTVFRANALLLPPEHEPATLSALTLATAAWIRQGYTIVGEERNRRLDEALERLRHLACPDPNAAWTRALARADAFLGTAIPPALCTSLLDSLPENVRIPRETPPGAPRSPPRTRSRSRANTR